MSYQRGGREHMQRAGTRSASAPRTPSTVTTDPATQTCDQVPDHATTAEPKRPTKQCALQHTGKRGEGGTARRGPASGPHASLDTESSPVPPAGPEAALRARKRRLEASHGSLFAPASHTLRLPTRCSKKVSGSTRAGGDWSSGAVEAAAV